VILWITNSPEAVVVVVAPLLVFIGVDRCRSRDKIDRTLGLSGRAWPARSQTAERSLLRQTGITAESFVRMAVDEPPAAILPAIDVGHA
jgi:hypothetical protein